MTADEVLETVGGLIREVIGEEWVSEVPITMNTSFNEDLELESIEFVVLAENIRARFGGEVEFIQWISELELDEIIGLRVGQVVDFILQCHS